MPRSYPRRSTQDSAGSSQGDMCWICLDGPSSSQPLDHPCVCPSLRCHRACLARWQLQKSGTPEEHTCRFCNTAYRIDWGECLLPESARRVEADAVMAVVYNGVVHKIRVRPGVEGEAEFKARVKTLFGFAHDSDFDVTFEVKIPHVPGSLMPATNDSKLLLKGINCFEAAATCAKASAVSRVLQTQLQQGASPAPPAAPAPAVSSSSSSSSPLPAVATPSVTSPPSAHSTAASPATTHNHTLPAVHPYGASSGSGAHPGGIQRQRAPSSASDRAPLLGWAAAGSLASRFPRFTRGSGH